MLCDDLEEWDGGWVGGRLKSEGINVYFWLIHVAMWQKPTQHRKAIILQLKIFQLRKLKADYKIY